MRADRRGVGRARLHRASKVANRSAPVLGERRHRCRRRPHSAIASSTWVHGHRAGAPPGSRQRAQCTGVTPCAELGGELLDEAGLADPASPATTHRDELTDPAAAS